MNVIHKTGMSTHVSHVWRGQKTYLGGAPRSNGVGEVLLFVNDQGPWLTLYRTLRGDKFGSGFGYSITTVDINNDGCVYNISLLFLVLFIMMGV